MRFSLEPSLVVGKANNLQIIQVGDKHAGQQQNPQKCDQRPAHKTARTLPYSREKSSVVSSAAFSTKAPFITHGDKDGWWMLHARYRLSGTSTRTSGWGGYADSDRCSAAALQAGDNPSGPPISRLTSRPSSFQRSSSAANCGVSQGLPGISRVTMRFCLRPPTSLTLLSSMR